ncbi:MAG: TonB-dependent receptor [Bacteroidetes bacterium]|nr:TonB-dependent receptor [Bacteroidota bacterium]
MNWERTNHAIQAGIRLHTDAIDRFQWVDDYQMGNRSLALISEGTPGTESNRILRSRVYAGFGEYTYQKNSLTVQIGGRLEYIEAEREDYGKEDPDRTGQDLSERSNKILTFLPGVSVDYKLSDKSNGFASVVRGFTPPGDSEETDPEQSINSELGLRYFEGKKVQFQLTGFWHQYQNLLGNRLVAGGNPAAVDAINGGAARSARGNLRKILYSTALAS